MSKLAESFLKYKYDWLAISRDATNVFDIKDPLVQNWANNSKPNKFVCSSLAAYVYYKIVLDGPNEGRFTTPADWVMWINANKFNWDDE